MNLSVIVRDIQIPPTEPGETLFIVDLGGPLRPGTKNGIGPHSSDCS
jgi:hypothetical protein